MSVTLRTMTPEEFEVFYQWSMERHAEELMEENRLSAREATEAAAKELAQMLPQGYLTENHCFFTIRESDTEESAGFIWTIHEETDGKRQSFLCDFAIWEQKRRRGYGAAALSLLERREKDAGCEESVLFVADRNLAAVALYKKCGYVVLRPSGCGNYMIKKL